MHQGKRSVNRRRPHPPPFHPPAYGPLATETKGVRPVNVALGWLGLEAVDGGALEDRAVDRVAGAVAGAVPGALGAVEVDLAAHVGARGGECEELAVRGAVARDLLAAVADDVA